MKKLLSLIMVFIISISNLLPFMPIIKVYATSNLSEIRLTSSTTSVQPGTLSEYSAVTTTNHVTEIDEYSSSSTYWA